MGNTINTYSCIHLHQINPPQALCPEVLLQIVQCGQHCQTHQTSSIAHLPVHVEVLLKVGQHCKYPPLTPPHPSTSTPTHPPTSTPAHPSTLTSICILRCCLKLDSSVRKMASDSSNTSGTELTPFLDRATHRYCLMALMNMSFVRNTGPAFCRMDSRSCSDKILERSSCDLQKSEKNL